METTTRTDELIAHFRATTAIARVGGPNGLVLPEVIQRAARVKDGDTAFLEVLDGDDESLRIQIRRIDPEQVWGWTPESLASLQETEENYAAGRFTTYYSTEEFLAALDQWSKDADV